MDDEELLVGLADGLVGPPCACYTAVLYTGSQYPNESGKSLRLQLAQLVRRSVLSKGRDIADVERVPGQGQGRLE